MMLHLMQVDDMNRITKSIAAVALVAGVFGCSSRSELPENVPDVSPDSDLTLRIDLSEEKLYVEQDGDVKATYAVASGSSNHPTPEGTFSIQHIIWNPRWVPPNQTWADGRVAREPGDPLNPMGKVKIFFNEPDYYIHGAGNGDSLGDFNTHGCVRMKNSDAIAIAKLLERYGGADSDNGDSDSTHSVRLSKPVQLVITG